MQTVYMAASTAHVPCDEHHAAMLKLQVQVARFVPYLSEGLDGEVGLVLACAAPMAPHIWSHNAAPARNGNSSPHDWMEPVLSSSQPS